MRTTDHACSPDASVHSSPRSSLTSYPSDDPMTPNVDDALALARAIGRADREAVDALLDDLGITSSEKAASLVGYLCGLLIGMAQLHAARTGESWEDLLTQFGKVATSGH